MIIICLPLIAIATADLAASAELKNIIEIGIVGLAIITLLAQFGRGRGKAIEENLFSIWGGKPTTIMLRHRDRRIEVQTKLRLHKRLDEKVPDIKIPSYEQEVKNPEMADRIYDSAVAWLRSSTRDKDQFPRLYEDNISYGFRRNLLGLKPLGLSISFAVLILKVTLEWPYSIEKIAGLFVQPTILTSILVALFFVAFVNDRWVKNAADSYASALFDAVEFL